MEGSLVFRLDALRPELNRRWSDLLRTAPPSPAVPGAIVAPAMLVFMVDDTSRRLLTYLAESALHDRQRRDLSAAGPGKADCPCGLHLMFTYYLAGVRALREILPADWGPERVEVVRCFSRMAHDEMAALCGVCLDRGRGNCRFRVSFPAKPTPRQSTASP